VTDARVLVAGVGNVLLGDDGFGSEVARRMQSEPWPPGVRVVDYGIRGVDLAFDLAAGYDLVVLVDLVSRGGTPGTLYVIEPVAGAEWERVADAHGMHPAAALGLARQLGGDLPELRLVGCEPAHIPDAEDVFLELSAPVEGAVLPAIRAVRDLVQEAFAHA
jgi:hydrogenase maturation protease